jgi:hypothetical protein
VSGIVKPRVFKRDSVASSTSEQLSRSKADEDNEHQRKRSCTSQSSERSHVTDQKKLKRDKEKKNRKALAKLFRELEVELKLAGVDCESGGYHKLSSWNGKNFLWSKEATLTETTKLLKAQAELIQDLRNELDLVVRRSATHA